MDGLPAGVAPSPGEKADEPHALAYDTALSTLAAVLVYALLKVSLDGLRQWRARIPVLVVGSGPVGLTAALVAVRSGKVLKLTVLDERCRSALLSRPQQIALDPRSVNFLLGLGVDFDNMEGCWHNEHFFTRIGVFQEYLLSILEKKKQKVDVKVQLGTKVSRWCAPKVSHSRAPEFYWLLVESTRSPRNLLSSCEPTKINNLCTKLLCSAYFKVINIMQQQQQQQESCQSVCYFSPVVTHFLCQCCSHFIPCAAPD